MNDARASGQSVPPAHGRKTFPKKKTARKHLLYNDHILISLLFFLDQPNLATIHFTRFFSLTYTQLEHIYKPTPVINSSSGKKRLLRGPVYVHTTTYFFDINII
uniref:Uncharacterized protein n=1 Tax=Hordeum vulgare subsp. vulgare TaxID=112509 RepID=A0A8I6Y3X7_HORVV